MASGWPAGFGGTAWRRTSSTRRALPWREHRRAKTDRLDTELLKRAFLGWLRGERDHCSMAAIPTIEEEDGRHPHRECESLVAERTRIINRMKGCLARLGIRGFKPTLQRAMKLLPTLRTPEGTPLPPNALAEMGRDLARLHFVEGQIREIEMARLERLEQAPTEKSHAMVQLLARIIGVGVETADMLVRVLSRNLRDRRAVARYAGLTGAPDESGSKRREKGLARAGNARVRRGMILGLALPDVSEGKRSRAVVPLSHRRCTSRDTEVADCRYGAQAADRAMAFCDDRRDARRGRDAPGVRPSR
jgi:transposase